MLNTIFNNLDFLGNLQRVQHNEVYTFLISVEQRNPKQKEKEKFYVSIKNYQLIRLEDCKLPITSQQINFDRHIELLFFFLFWIPLLVSFQKNIYFMDLNSLQVAQKNWLPTNKSCEVVRLYQKERRKDKQKRSQQAAMFRAFPRRLCVRAPFTNGKLKTLIQCYVQLSC